MMYGISLSRDGTTKVVSQRLEQRVALEEDARLEGDRAGSVSEDAEVGLDGTVVEVPAGEPVR
jgi:hypothetical protein